MNYEDIEISHRTMITNNQKEYDNYPGKRRHAGDFNQVENGYNA